MIIRKCIKSDNLINSFSNNFHEKDIYIKYKTDIDFCIIDTKKPNTSDTLPVLIIENCECKIIDPNSLEPVIIPGVSNKVIEEFISSHGLNSSTLYVYYPKRNSEIIGFEYIVSEGQTAIDYYYTENLVHYKLFGSTNILNVSPESIEAVYILK